MEKRPSGIQRTAMLSGQARRAEREAAELRRGARKREAETRNCGKERDDAHKGLNKDQSEYDKQLLALSGAFLALSLAFIKDVVPLPQAKHLWELYLSFGLMAICVCLVLASFQISINGQFRVMSFWELKEEALSIDDVKMRAEIGVKLENLRERIESHGEKIKWWNWSSGISFGLGVVFLIVFVISNIRMESRVPVHSECTLEGHKMLSLRQPQPQTPSPPQFPGPSNPIPSRPTPHPGSYPKVPKSTG